MARRLALHSPICQRHNGWHIPLCDRFTPPFGGRWEQYRLLDVPRDAQQIHDLREPGPANVPQSGQFRLFGHRAVFDKTLETDLQYHQLGKKQMFAQITCSRLRRPGEPFVVSAPLEVLLECGSFAGCNLNRAPDYNICPTSFFYLV